MNSSLITAVLLLIIASCLTKEHHRRKKDIPGEPRYPAAFGIQLPINFTGPSRLNVKRNTNVWEESGLFEGDIMMKSLRNVIKDEYYRWPNATVPYYIDPSDFNSGQEKVILAAMKDIERKTCVTFREYTENDGSYLTIRGNSKGCWSLVGRYAGGQVLNLHPDSREKKNCVKHGTVIHELLHALGLYHQQSSYDRDDYVEIVWKNIQEGKERNFMKRDLSQTMDLHLEYDFGSIMHYSKYAFSKNGQSTIVPKVSTNTPIGQRHKMSQTDIRKVLEMYQCPR